MAEIIPVPQEEKLDDEMSEQETLDYLRKIKIKCLKSFSSLMTNVDGILNKEYATNPSLPDNLVDSFDSIDKNLDKLWDFFVAIGAVSDEEEEEDDDEGEGDENPDELIEELAGGEDDNEKQNDGPSGGDSGAGDSTPSGDSGDEAPHTEDAQGDTPIEEVESPEEV